MQARVCVCFVVVVLLLNIFNYFLGSITCM